MINTLSTKNFTRDQKTDYSKVGYNKSNLAFSGRLNNSKPAQKVTFKGAGGWMKNMQKSVANWMDKMETAVAKKMPDMNLPLGATSKLGEMKSHTQRAVIAVIELGTQPFMDWWSNRKETKDTRKYSVVKTTAKIFAGASVGCGTRFLTAQAIESLKKGNKIPLLNKKPYLAEGLKQSAGFVMTVITMFTADLPITNLIINSFLRKVFPEKFKKEKLNKSTGGEHV